MLHNFTSVRKVFSVKSTIIYTFPLLGPIRKPVCTFLSSFTDNIHALIIKGVLDPSKQMIGMFAPLHLFLIDVVTENIEHKAINLPENATIELSLCYNHDEEQWILAENGNKIIVYEISRNDTSVIKKAYEVEDSIVGFASKTLISVSQKKDAYPLLFSVVDAEEVNPSNIYFAQWNGTQKQKNPQNIGCSNINTYFIKDDKYALFSCKKSIDFDSRANNIKAIDALFIWQPIIEFYDFQGLLLRREVLEDLYFPVYHAHLINDDFANHITYSVSLIDGPIIQEKDDTIAVAVQGSFYEDEYSYKSGLYCISRTDGILQFLSYPLGIKVSMCTCGTKIFGTDILNGNCRIWSWTPLLDKSLLIHVELSQDVRRAVLVAMDRKQAGADSQFWCIEEYSKGLKVSKWSSTDVKELSFVWCEEFSLLNESLPFFNENKPLGIVATQDKLFIIVVNEQKKLQILRCQ